MGMEHEASQIDELQKKTRENLQKCSNALVRFEIDGAAAETSTATFRTLNDSVPEVKRLLKQHGKTQLSIPETAEVAAMAALMANFTKTMEEKRKVESERLLRGVEHLGATLQKRGREARSHGHLTHALTYLPIPNAQRIASPLASIVATGASVISMLDDKLLDPVVTSFLNLSLHGTQAHHLRGKVRHQATLDWLEKADAVEIARVAPEFEQSCLFVSTSKACTPERHADMTQLVHNAHGEDAPLHSILSVASLPVHGSHAGSEDDPMHARTHFCYDVASSWIWMVGKGLRIPSEGLAYLARGTVPEIEAAFPKALPNPARFPNNVCPGRLKMGFEASKEPLNLPWRDVETLLHAVVALLYLEVLEGLAAESFSDCGGEMRRVEKSFRGKKDQNAKYKAVFQELVAPDDHATPSKRRIALILYYLYGPAGACASFDSLYPHGQAMQEMLRDLSEVREKLAPVAAQVHHRTTIVSLAQTGLTRLGRTYMGHAFRAAKSHTKNAVRKVLNLAQKFMDLQFYFSFLKPVFCLLAFAGFFFFSEGNAVKKIVAVHGLEATVLHLLFGKLTSQAFTCLHEVYITMTSISAKNTEKALYLVNVIWRYLLGFLEKCLPESKKLWEGAIAAYHSGKFAGFTGYFLQKLPYVGSVAGTATGIFQDYKNAEALTLSAMALNLMPLQAFVTLGTKVGECVKYVAPGGAFGGLHADAPFFLRLLEICVMVWLGNTTYVFLRFMEFLCREFHAERTSKEVKDVCAERAEKYRYTLMFLGTAQRIFAFFATGGIQTLLEALSTLLTEGLEDSFRTVCMGELHVPQLADTVGTNGAGHETIQRGRINQSRLDRNLPAREVLLTDDEKAFEKFYTEHNEYVSKIMKRNEWKGPQETWNRIFGATKDSLDQGDHITMRGNATVEGMAAPGNVAQAVHISKVRNATVEGMTPPGNVALAASAAKNLEVARESAEEAKKNLEKLQEMRKNVLQEQHKRIAEGHGLTSQIAKETERAFTGKTALSDLQDFTAMRMDQHAASKAAYDRCTVKHPSWWPQELNPAWRECYNEDLNKIYGN